MVKIKKKAPKRPKRGKGWRYNNLISETLPEYGITQKGEKLEQVIDSAIQARPDSGLVAGSSHHEQAVSEYEQFKKDFNKKAEDYAVALTDTLSRCIASKSSYGFPGAFCVAGALNADKQTMKKHPEFMDFHLPVTTASATGASEQMAKIFGNDGFSYNLHEAISAQIAENPTVPQVFSVQRSSKFSNSGLHYVTVAPKKDKSGEIVRDEAGNVKYAVYSFNKNSITDFDTNETLKTSGHCYNVTQMAFVKEQEHFYFNTLMPIIQKEQVETGFRISPQTDELKLDNPINSPMNIVLNLNKNNGR